MKVQKFNWDDLRIFLAVARSQSAFEAAAGMGMNQSTVTRRLQRLEADTGSKLFDRSSQGHRLTSAGHRLMEHVEQLESSMAGLESSVFGDSQALTGEIRIGATEAFGSFFLAPHLAHFCMRHPAIKVDLLPMPRNINLSKREADMSVTLERPTDERVVSAKLLDYRMRPYAAKEYLGRSPTIRTAADLAEHRWIGYVDDLIFTDQQPSLRNWIPSSDPFFRSTSMTAQYQAVRAGLGIAVLPCFLGNTTEGLVPLLAEEIDIVRTFWLAAPMERRELFRVRALWDYLRRVAELNQSFLMGEASHMIWHAQSLPT